jgi:hypothetical protein
MPLSDEDRERNKAVHLFQLRQAREEERERLKTQCTCEASDGTLPAECWCERRTR